MSRYLSSLLSLHPQLLSRRLQLLEDATMRLGTDVRLTAEIRLQLKEKLAELQLDPSNTTAAELFAMLRNKVRQDDQILHELFGITAADESSIMLCKTVKNLSKVSKRQLWSIKRTALKRILVQCPPQKAMKSLHYRSQASMLKRESPITVYAVAMLVENNAYKKKLHAAFTKLKASDFEVRPTELVCIDEAKWESIHKSLKNNIVPIIGLPEVNGVTVAPIKTTHTSGLVLLATALIFTEMQRAAAYASYTKVHSLSARPGQALHDIATESLEQLSLPAELQANWEHLHRFIFSNESHVMTLGPHMGVPDFVWEQTEAQLAQLHPALSFWLGTHITAFVSETHVVSLHILDCALNVLYGLTPETASRQFVQRAVHDELLMRYLLLPPFNELAKIHIQNIAERAEDTVSLSITTI